jgi:AraC-like DNA-binding protein
MSRDATVSVRGAMAIPAVLQGLGASPARVFDEAGVDLELFDDADNVISLSALGRLLKRCVARTGCQHFGFLVGQRGGLRTVGLIGLVVRYSPDVGTALVRLGTYLHLQNNGAIMTVADEGEVATLSYDVFQPGVEAVEQIGDAAVATQANILRALCGPDWQPIEVRLAHRAPGDARQFRRFFQAPVRFDAEQNLLVFSAHWLKLALPEADAELQRLLQKQIDALEAKHGDEFPEQVRSVLRTGLLTGHGGANQVAALFSIHSRTLTRRLAAFGTSFKTLVDEGRYEISRQMLLNTTLDVGRIAEALDYADASAFTRAFRRWSGTTPAAWRAKGNSGIAGNH